VAAIWATSTEIKVEQRNFENRKKKHHCQSGLRVNSCLYCSLAGIDIDSQKYSISAISNDNRFDSNHSAILILIVKSILLFLLGIDLGMNFEVASTMKNTDM
jgi:hypothetical protein